MWAMLVPQGLGYAALAGMPAVAGLYAAFGALLLYWLWVAARSSTSAGINGRNRAHPDGGHRLR